MVVTALQMKRTGHFCGFKNGPWTTITFSTCWRARKSTQRPFPINFLCIISLHDCSLTSECFVDRQENCTHEYHFQMWLRPKWRRRKQSLGAKMLSWSLFRFLNAQYCTGWHQSAWWLAARSLSLMLSQSVIRCSYNQALCYFEADKLYRKGD